MKFNTRAIHGGQQNIDPAYNSVMPPIYQTTTYAQSAPGVHKGFEYSRSGNPTREALEKAIASIENGTYGLAFGSGLAAIDAVLKMLKPGDEVICTSDLYGGSYRLFTKVFSDFGIKFHFIGMENAEDIENVVNAQTRLVWVETPTNPMMNIIDIEAIARITQNHRLLLAVDNTFATAYLQRPLDLGADIVMHSATKYLGGHSDVVMIKTLHVRMQRHCENAKAVAHALKANLNVGQVYWPGFEDHPNHEIAKRQMSDYGGMVSFTTKAGTLESAVKTLEKLKVFPLAESLGGVESLAGHPTSMTHASIPKEDREKTGVVDSLIRLSVGIEDIDDLLTDLEQALN